MKLASLFFLYFTLLLLLVLFFFFFLFPPLIVRDNISPKFRQGWMIRWKVLQLGATVSFFFLGEGGFAFSLFLSAWPAITSKHPVNLVHIFYSSSFLFLSFKKKKKKKRNEKNCVYTPYTHTHTSCTTRVLPPFSPPLYCRCSMESRCKLCLQ